MDSWQLRIAVLVSIGRNPVSGVARPDRNDLLALELARKSGGEVTILHAGDPNEPALADYLAYSAAPLEIIPVPAGQDIVPPLAARLQGFHLILTGSRTEGGEASGMLPYALARRLGLPIVAQALDLALAEGQSEVTQFLPKGQRRRVTVRLPAIIAVHPMAPLTPRYSHLRRVAGQSVTLPAPASSEAASTAWATEPARKPIVLKAAEKKSGHARMAAAITSESKGGTIITDGTPAEKAQAILTYLRSHRLIEF
jgi:electron transfer flavoprotein beta subunit